MKNESVISIKNYSMNLGGRRVIHDLSFDVYQGDVFGLLGSNGSGKTTTIRTLLGIYRATEGQLTINGQPFDPSTSGTLGYLPEERGLYKKETVIDTMVYFGQLKNMSRSEARKWSLEYLERVELEDKANLKLDTLSGGQQQKIQLGVTIMNRPKLLILDEPTKGFDPVNRRLMLDIVRERMDEGATVVLVTHQMEEVERLCNRLILLKDGRKRLYGTMAEIKQSYGSDAINLEFSGTLQANDALFSIAHQTKESATLIPTKNTSSQQVFAGLANQKKLKISRFEVEQASLDDIFVQIYEEDRKDKNA